jgi:hypothetical protein
MPFSIVKKSPKCWEVINTESGKIHSKCSTESKAKAQMKLLYGVESGKWKPTKASGCGGIGVGGEIPWIAKLRIAENPYIADGAGMPSNLVGKNQYDTFISRSSQAFSPTIKKPLFQQG